ncbi:MAG TPA: hypothetical protein PKA64_06570 [Myxococcota bacterium]|nr:hypothetical protein [Myxococcota bacterium]
MHVALHGSSPSTMTAGILLLTRARQLGYSLTVAIVGDGDDLQRIEGPAVAYAPVLASCGVGRDLGSGATVVVPGPPGSPVRVTLTPHGVDGWFCVDRAGHGVHPATQAFVRMSHDVRPEARALGRDVRKAMEALGMAADPAVLDVLFGAPVPPLLRLAVALRAGRAMSGGRGDPITRYLAGDISLALDPIPAGLDANEVAARYRRGDLQWVFNRLAASIRDRAEAWVDMALQLAAHDEGRDLALLASLLEMASHLAQLPMHSILPPLGAGEDSVAVALKAALHADGDGDANLQLSQVYRFLGGRFVPDDPHALFVSREPKPADPTDQVGLWRWFAGEVRVGRKRADALWDQIFNPAE